MKAALRHWLVLSLALGLAADHCAGQQGVAITGIVTGPDGKPAAGVRVSVEPSYSSSTKLTDAEGAYRLTYDPRQFGGRAANQMVLIARDFDHNLAAAVDLEEDTTNANVRLAPALTIGGRITDSSGKFIPRASAQAYFHTESMSSSLGSRVRADAEGRFEIKALPQGREYSVNASARGYGQVRVPVEASAAETTRLELDVCQLALADQRIAGLVLDDEDKPVARASLYTYGENQPNVSAQTDSQGRFKIERICPGPIEISANGRDGAYGHVSAEAGDTNLVIHASKSRGYTRTERPSGRLQGKPLPDLAPVGLTPEQVPPGQPVLAVLIDAEQRPSRRALRVLGEQSAALKEKGVTVVVLQAGGMSPDTFNTWKRELALPFPMGCLPGTAEKARTTWGASALPWFILADKSHRVAAEGFPVEEVDTRINALAK